MNKIKQPEAASDKVTYYLSEYRKEFEKLKHIRSMLEVLNEESQGLVTDVRIKANMVGSAAASALEGALPKENRNSTRGRKSKWGSFIMHRLKKLKRPLSYEEILDDVTKVFGLQGEEEIESTRKVIFSTCYRLKEKEKLIHTFRIKGQRGKYIALNKWCTPGGKLKKEFALKIAEDHRNVTQ